MAEVGLIMGSESDMPTLEPAVVLLKEFGVAHEVLVVSAHRTPHRMAEYAETARSRGIKVIIAAAGGAAHLPGMTASFTTLPVIGVPVKTQALSGVDSLHSIVQMPAGVPVATVGIGNGANAALLAIQILSIHDPRLALRLEHYRRGLVEKVGKMNENVSSTWQPQDD